MHSGQTSPTSRTGTGSPPVPTREPQTYSPPTKQPQTAQHPKAKQEAKSDKTSEMKIPRKPYEEIGAIFNGNEIKIRIPKTTFKPPKLTPSQQNLQQQCTCEDEGSICSDECGIPAPGNMCNSLNFQIPDDICEGLTNRTAVNSELTYCKQEMHNNLCNVCNVTPKNAPKGVHAHKVLHPDKDVFLLKIGKQTDEPNRTGNIVVELITPRAPAKPKPATHSCKQIQCEEEEIPCCLTCRSCVPTIRRRRPRRYRCCK